MKQENKTSTNKFPIKGLAALAIVLLAVVAITSFNLGKNNATKASSPIPVVDLSNNNPGISVLGQQIYNWTGKITDITDISIVLEVTTQTSEKKLEKKKIKAIYNDKTEIKKWDLAQAPQNAKASSKSEISISNLRIGNDIIIKSTEPLDENNEVQAMEINLLITP